MSNESLVSQDWLKLVERLGGAACLEASARETKAFVRPREIKCAVDLLRLVLAYCLGTGGLRSTAAWATAIGLVDVSNPAVLYRLQQCGETVFGFNQRGTGTSRAESSGRPADLHHRWHDRAESRRGRAQEKRFVAHPRGIFIAGRAFQELRIDG